MTKKTNKDSRPFDIKFQEALRKRVFTNYIHDNLQFRKGKTPKTHSNKAIILKYDDVINDKDARDVDFIAEYVCKALFSKFKQSIVNGYKEEEIRFLNPETKRFMNQHETIAYASENELTEQDVENLEYTKVTTKQIPYNCNFKLTQKYVDLWDNSIDLREFTEKQIGSFWFYYKIERQITDKQELEVDEASEKLTGKVIKREFIPTSRYDIKVYVGMKARTEVEKGNL